MDEYELGGCKLVAERGEEHLKLIPWCIKNLGKFSLECIEAV